MEIIDAEARSFYEYASFFICIAIIFGYYPYLKSIFHSKAGLPKISWFLSLAVSDLLIAANIAFGSLVLFTKTESRTEFGCQFYAWMSLGCGFVNIASAAFNALDRHHRVFDHGQEEMTAFGKIVGVWITCFVTAALPWIGLGRFEHLNKDTVMCLIDLEQSQAYIYTVATLWFVVPLAVIHASYAELSKKSLEYKKMTMVTRALLLSYLPYAFHAVATTTFGLTFPPIVTAINHLFPKLLSVMNPHLYLNDPMIKQLNKKSEINGHIETAGKKSEINGQVEISGKSE